jgi:L-alanine-DL-glutamate epimerase-like enolase superfamily enzyme
LKQSIGATTSATTKRKIKLSHEKLDLELEFAFGIARGTEEIAPNLLVILEHGDLIGYGESAPEAVFGETPETAQALLTAIDKEGILGNDPFAIESIGNQLDRYVTGHNSVKAAINMALYDLVGKITGLPLYKYLGLSAGPLPAVQMTIGISDVENTKQKVKNALAKGHKHLKIKLGSDHDHEILEAVREIEPNMPLRVDANCAWSLKESLKKVELLAAMNVELIEQPIKKTSSAQDFEYLRDSTDIMIFADESVMRAEDAARLAGAIDGVVIKLAKAGGISQALKLIHTARALDLKIMLGCMVESSLGTTAACHLASLVDYSDLDGALLLKNDPFRGVTYKDGYLSLPDGPGLGVVKV